MSCAFDSGLGVRGGLRLFRGDGFDAGVEAALVARGGVGVEDALLHALVEDGDGGAVLLAGGFGVALLDGFAEGAQAGAELGAVGAVHRGTFYGLPDALERGNMVRHE